MRRSEATYLLSKQIPRNIGRGGSEALQAPQVTPPAPPHRTLLKVTVSLRYGGIFGGGQFWNFGRYLVAGCVFFCVCVMYYQQLWLACGIPIDLGAYRITRKLGIFA